MTHIEHSAWQDVPQERDDSPEDLRLSRLASGEASPEEAARLFKQMRDHPWLKHRFEDYLTLEAILDDIRPQEPPEPIN